MKFNFQNYQQLQIDSESYKIPLVGTVRLVHHRGMSLATSYTFSQTSVRLLHTSRCINWSQCALTQTKCCLEPP